MIHGSENGLVTSDGTKVLTVEEFDKFLTCITKRYKPIFELDTITGMRYVEVQRLYEQLKWYSEARNQIILPPEAQQKVKQKLVKRTIDKLPSTFPYILEKFLAGPRPPDRIESKTTSRSVTRPAGSDLSGAFILSLSISK
jgi:hypothetical protein